MFAEKINNRAAGIVTYGMTPPKAHHEPDKLREISQKQYERLKDLDIDALLLYDVQEEAERAEKDRPFPYLPTIDPVVYSDQFMPSLPYATIAYRCVGKYTEAQFGEWVEAKPEQSRFSVYVGPSSSTQQVSLSLSSAYALSQRLNPKLTFGGVVIPERHMTKKDEHLRVVQKMKNGCAFFVSQAVYDLEASKQFLADYSSCCASQEIEMVPILFNLAPCGSAKTLEFMQWLGIHIPASLERELRNCSDVLEKSVELSYRLFAELYDYGMRHKVPVGCSVESVSTRKVEIEAAVQLVKDIRKLLGSE